MSRWGYPTFSLASAILRSKPGKDGFLYEKYENYEKGAVAAALYGLSCISAGYEAVGDCKADLCTAAQPLQALGQDREIH